MRKTLPVIAEAAKTLKPRLRHAHHGRTRLRGQRLDRFASGPARRRQNVAQRLGVHRNTIGHWLAAYEAGGLTAVLERYVPAGKPVSLPPDVLTGLEPARRQPAGCAAYEALRPWVKQTSRLEVN